VQKRQVIRGRLLDETEPTECTLCDVLKSDLDHSTAAAIRSAIRQGGSDRA
jgi:hypothetical protein